MKILVPLGPLRLLFFALEFCVASLVVFSVPQYPFCCVGAERVAVGSDDRYDNQDFFLENA